MPLWALALVMEVFLVGAGLAMVAWGRGHPPGYRYPGWDDAEGMEAPPAPQPARSGLYHYVPHPHIGHHRSTRPVKVADQLRRDNAVQRFNARAALLVTRAVGTMWCAYAFGLFDLLSLPTAIKGGTATLVSWVAQTFLQLVLLSVIMVGQSVQAKAADKRSEDTYKDAEAVLAECVKLQEHLLVQDAVLERLSRPAP